MVKIEWTRISQKDLKEIYDFIAEDSIRYAVITVNKIYQNVQSIKYNPFLARIVPEINDEKIREVISGNYRIVFKIIDQKLIHILRIYHSARLLKKDVL
jgi:plasmid stabilization system protein ParE